MGEDEGERGGGRKKKTREGGREGEREEKDALTKLLIYYLHNSLL